MKATIGLLALGGLVAAGLAAHFSDREVIRIQRHLAAVEQELRSRDVSHLAAEQRSARLNALDALHEYWRAGRFPKNLDFPGRRVPYFVDAHGTRCAMAHLIAESGRLDLVTAVASLRNNATVFDLAADPVLGKVLGAWLTQNGLTVEEAARIQPSYGCTDWQCRGSRVGSRVGSREISTGQAVSSMVVAGAGIVGSVLNATGDARWHAAAGMTAGMLGVAIGVSLLPQDGPARSLGMGDLALGLVATLLGAGRLLEQEDREPIVEPRVVAEPDRRGLGVSLNF